MVTRTEELESRKLALREELNDWMEKHKKEPFIVSTLRGLITGISDKAEELGDIEAELKILEQEKLKEVV